CILSDAVPQSICFLCVSTEKPLCCLTCFCHIVQFSRCRSPSASFRLSPAQLPTAFAVRFEDPIFRSGLQIQRQI
ncbi:putative transcriptional regulator, partial [Dysosmobacter welbionis]